MIDLRSMATQPAKLRAVDVLNWDYLVHISTEPQTGLASAYAKFAYAFTSTADDGIRDAMLVEVIKKGTNHCSNVAKGHHLGAIAKNFKSDFARIREFAKQNGVTIVLWKLPGFFDPSTLNP